MPSLLLMPRLQPELATLTNAREPEADFFLNITHVQLPRRQRALARLRVRTDEGALTGESETVMKQLSLRSTRLTASWSSEEPRLSR